MIYACIGALVSSLSNNTDHGPDEQFLCLYLHADDRVQVLAINDAVKPACGLNW